MTAMLNRKNGGGECEAEKTLMLRTFTTSDSLKDEIRRLISEYQQIGWQFICMSAEGALIHLKFKKQER